MAATIDAGPKIGEASQEAIERFCDCLLYTSDAADE